MIQSNSSLWSGKMELSLREELIILTSCFCFCLFVIPIVIFYAQPISRHSVFEDENFINRYSELEFQKKILVHSVEILEILNRHKNNNETLVEFSDLLGISEVKFRQKYGKVFHKSKLISRKSPKIFKSVWNTFGFSGKNILKGSLKLPLTVDW